MDKVNTYRNLVKTLLSEIATTFRKSNQWEILEAYDDERGNIFYLQTAGRETTAITAVLCTLK